MEELKQRQSLRSQVVIPPRSQLHCTGDEISRFTRCGNGENGNQDDKKDKGN